MQVRLQVGRLTLDLTAADRWECSQATGLPAWRRQDLSTSQPLGHTISRALKHDELGSPHGYLGYVTKRGRGGGVSVEPLTWFMTP